MGKEIVIEIKRPEIIVLIIFLSVALYLELQVTLNTPIVFGDEGWHTKISQYMAENLDYFKWVSVVEGTKLISPGFHRVPLWNLSEAGFYLVFGFNDIIVKFLTPFIGTILIGLVVFLIGSEIKNKETGILASIIVMSAHSILTYSILFYSDIFFAFYLTLFFLSFVKAVKNKKKIYWILTGLLAGLAFLSDASGYLLFPFIIIVSLYQFYKEKQFFGLLKNYVLLLIPFTLIMSAYFLRTFLLFNTPFCMTPILVKFSNVESCNINLEYESTYHYEGVGVETGTEMSILKMGLLNYFSFAYGNYQIGPIVIPFVFFIMCGLFAILWKKDSYGVYILCMLITFLFIFYRSITGRAEDASRNTLGIVSFFAIIAGIYIESLYSFLKKYSKYLGFVLIIFIIFLSFGSIYPKLQSLKPVKAFSSYFFEACDFIKKNTTENALLMTIWDHGTIYNCQRRATSFGYLPDSPDIVISGNLTLALDRLKAHGITHIFIQKFSVSNRLLSSKYPTSFIEFMDANPEQFKKIYENGPSISSCETQNGYTQDGDLICDGALVYEIKYD